MAISTAVKPVACGLLLALAIHVAFVAASASEKTAEDVIATPLESLSLDELEDELQVSSTQTP